MKKYKHKLFKVYTLKDIMKINSIQLKEIIKSIEQHASINSIKILNSSTRISQPLKNKVIEIDLNKPQTYQIEFVMGGEKEMRP